MIHSTVDQRHTIQIFASAALALVFLSLMFSPLRAIELINGANSPLADVLMPVITNLGDGMIIIPAFGLLLFKRVYWALGLLFNGLVQAVLVTLCKRVFFPHSLRPINFLDSETIHILSGVEIHKHMTFPSGHTVTAFGIFTFIALCTNDRRIACILMLAATMVGLSRVYLLQHFLWDVAAGSVMGFAIGAFSYFLSHNSVKPGWMNHRFAFRVGRKERRSWS